MARSGAVCICCVLSPWLYLVSLVAWRALWRDISNEAPLRSTLVYQYQAVSCFCPPPLSLCDFLSWFLGPGLFCTQKQFRSTTVAPWLSSVRAARAWTFV